MTASNLRTRRSVTIATGTALSPAVNLGGDRIIGIEMPAAWTAAGITFQTSTDGTTFQNAYDSGGTEIALTVVAAHNVGLSDTISRELAHASIVKVRSGTGSVPVNQTGDAILILITQPSYT